MKILDWKLTINMNILTLKSVGLWPQNRIYTAILVIFVINAALIFQIVHITSVYTNLEDFTGHIFVTATQTLGSIKMCYFAKNLNILKRLMEKLESSMFQIKTNFQKEQVEPILAIWKTTYVTFWVLVSATTLLWSVIPLLNGSFNKYELPFAAWYPYDIKISPIYEITYLHQVIAIFLVAVSSLNIDTLMAALMMFTGCQCDILCDDLRKLRKISFERKFVNCIIHHQEILNFAQGCNQLLNIIVLGQFFTSSFTIGLAMFQLSLVDPLSNEGYSLLFYESAVTVQLFLYCWFGNEVEMRSSQIPYAAFESDWTGIPLEAKKNLIIFIIRTQRPIKMSAINLFSLSLATFTTILRTSWSYFAVLRTVNAPKQ